MCSCMVNCSERLGAMKVWLMSHSVGSALLVGVQTLANTAIKGLVNTMGD